MIPGQLSLPMTLQCNNLRRFHELIPEMSLLLQRGGRVVERTNSGRATKRGFQEPHSAKSHPAAERGRPWPVGGRRPEAGGGAAWQVERPARAEALAREFQAFAATPVRAPR